MKYLQKFALEWPQATGNGQGNWSVYGDSNGAGGFSMGGDVGHLPVMNATAEGYVPDEDSQLDKGIRDYVLALRAGGVETFESCEGGAGHCFADPTIRFYGRPEEGYRAAAWAMTQGLPVMELRRCWYVDGAELVGPHWEMTFRTI